MQEWRFTYPFQINATELFLTLNTKKCNIFTQIVFNIENILRCV